MKITFARTFLMGGILADPDSVVAANADSTWGIRRLDTGAVVVATGTPLTRQNIGVYSIDVDPADPGVVYEISVAATTNGFTSRFADTQTAPAARGTVPELLLAAVLLLVGHLYENREAASPVAITEMPMGLESILSLYRYRGF
jgi:hypothetical protein